MSIEELNEEIYYKVVNEDDSGLNQVRLVLNRFRGVEYLHLRNYYLDFEGDWYPTNKGFCTPLDLATVSNLFIGLAEVMSLAESRKTIEEFFGDVIRQVYAED